MSAIVALQAFNSFQFPKGSCESMLDALRHRGEDRVGTWSDDSVQLGSRLRFTTPESKSEQLPYQNPSSGCVITCDARLDNRPDLLTDLGFAESSPFPDGQLILASYEKWGLECLPHLTGDFVFAIWDPREQRLFCARDPLGIRNFYYHYQPGKLFALASEIKALWRTGEIPAEVDDVSVGDYLLFNFDDKERTFFREIKRLPATHAITVDRDGIKTWEYWRPDFERQLRLRDRREYAEGFRELFSAAVDRRVRAVTPVGSFLSGGLDSSAVTCVASKALASRGESLRSFSAVWTNSAASHPKLDERAYMESVIEKSGCIPSFVDYDDDNPWRDIEKLVQQADQPVGLPNLYVHWEIYKRAQSEGVGVLLDGFDGDTTVSHGYEIFEVLARRWRIYRLVKEARLLKRNIPLQFHSFENLVFKRGLDLAIPASLGGIWHAVSRRKRTGAPQTVASPTDRFRQVLDPEFLPRYLATKGSSSGTGVPGLQGHASFAQSHWRNLTSGMFAKCLEVSDIASQAFGVEARYPFFDQRLIEFCLAVPIEERVREGWTRAVFRSAMKDILPEDVRLRGSKGNLGIGLKLNIAKHSKRDLDLMLANEKLRRYASMPELCDVRKRFETNPLKTFDSDCMVLVAAVHLSRWLEKKGLHSGFNLV